MKWKCKQIKEKMFGSKKLQNIWWFRIIISPLYNALQKKYAIFIVALPKTGDGPDNWVSFLKQ